MEIPEAKFIEALIKYFSDTKIENEGQGLTGYAIECGRVANALNVLLKYPTRRRQLKMVHIGHTFGPFGFKVK